ncbi:DUF2637 domain-containing protein [Streptomyces cavernicola]|uniref:DUF2637 domain-containing protein n=1 Tax=Streptomyces cavernicola TaxID=3043613 RepID=A0ABT6SKZ8_9ACTN|nr:DUF2637 domain-containing protein [Streptomyces sp. B-S-A6]MDI3408337.1 DUF2637 domain-containing protein [Streptomyces sp. B-S-A6]
MSLSRAHRILIGVVIAGAVVIAAIGFAGSYAAVRELALKKGFGNFSYVFPIGIDAGICVLLALDLLLTWIRIPFPLLRQTAWLLTAATIAFNGAAAWPDPLGVGMHAVIPILFVVAVEAARHAIGRIADITADKHMEGVRLTRWLLSPGPTFLLWRRMKLWELRSYEQVIKLEQERLVYQARLRSRYGRNWRRKAPVESLMPLRLAKYGVPLADTAPAGLAAAGIEPTLLPSDGHDAEYELVRDNEQVEQKPLTMPAHDVVSDPPAAVEPSSKPAKRGEPETGGEHVEPTAASPADHVADTRAEMPASASSSVPVEQGGRAREDELVSVTAVAAAPESAVPVGAAADRTGSRRIVQMRLPHEEPIPTADADVAPPIAAANDAGEATQSTEEAKGARDFAPAAAGLKGADRVEFYYRQLSSAQKGLSANLLAPLLAAASGYKEGTVRKYIGALRRGA